MGDANSFINRIVGLPEDDSDISPGQRARRYPSGTQGPLQTGEQMPPLGGRYQRQEPSAPGSTSAGTASATRPGINSGTADLQAPTAPKLNQDYEAAQKRVRDYSAPTDKYIPGTNKVKPDYRMGVGGRIIGTVANFLSGFGGRGPVTYVGPGATNRAYDVAEERRQSALGKAQADVKSYQDAFSEEKKGYENELQTYEDQRKRLGQAPIVQSATMSMASAPAVNAGGQMQPAHESFPDQWSGINQFVAQPTATSAASAPVVTSAGQKQPAQKSVTKGRVLLLARKHKVPYTVAAQQFKDKGYVIK